MKAFTISLTLVSLLIGAFGPAPTEAIYNNICRLFADGVQLRDPYDCAAYITCTDSVEVKTECPKGQLYSITSSSCVASTAGCDDPCAPELDSLWTADEKSCNGYYYCNRGTGIFGVCPGDLHFDEDSQQCVYETDSRCGGDNYCHIVPNGINFRVETACDMYQYCEKAVLKSKACGTNEFYDRKLGKCSAALNGCDSWPTDICVKSKKPEKNKFVADKATCRGYYYCADKGDEADQTPDWGQCAEGTFFSYESQACVDPINVVCDHDRCEGRADGFVNSGKNCTYYLVCKNGVTIEEKICANHYFFDEKRGACTSELIQYKGCS